MRLLLLFLFLCLSSFQQSSTTKLTTKKVSGLRHIKTASALVLNVAEVEGMLFFALAQNVQLYLQDKAIVAIPYEKLTGGDSHTREEKVLFVPDTLHKRIYVIDDAGIGAIEYETQRTVKIATFHGVEKDVALFDAALINDTLIVSFPVETAMDSVEKKGNISIQITTKPIRQVDDLQIQSVEESGLNTLVDVKGVPKFWELIKLDRSDQNRYKEYLIATENDGLYYLQKTGDSIKKTYLKITLPDGTPITKIRSITYLQDWDAVLIGTVGQHAYLWSLAHNQVFTPFLDDKKIEKQNHFWNSCKASEDTYIAVNDIGTVFLMEASTQTKLDVDSLGAFMIRSVEKIERETFWIGTNSGKIFERRVKDRSFNQATAQKTVLYDFGASTTIYDLYAYKKDSIFMASSKGLGLFSKGQYEVIDNTHKEVGFITERLNRKDFFYGGERFLYVWDGGIFPIDLPDTLGMMESHITDVVPFQKIENNTRSSYLAICTRENSIYIVQWDMLTKTIIGEVVHFNAGKGLVYYANDGTSVNSITIYGGVLFEESNVIWFSSNFGLLAYDIGQEQIFFYEEAGAALEYNTKGFHQQNDSIVIFSTLQGLVKVNAKEAKRQRTRIAEKIKPQIWEIKSETSLTDDIYNPSRYYKKLSSHPDSTYPIAFEETDRRFFIVAPNYSMLNRNNFTLIREDTNTLEIFDDQVLRSKELLGSFPKFSFGTKNLSFSSNPNKFQFNVGWDFKTLAIIASIFAALSALIIYLRGRQLNRAKIVAEQERQKAIGARKKETAARQLAEKNQLILTNQTEKNNLRRQLFVQLQEKLSKAKGYTDIQKAFLTIQKDEMESTMEATKMTLYKYEKGENQLRILGHTEPRIEAELTPDKVQNKVLSLGNENYPAVYFWNHIEQADFIEQRETNDGNDVTFYRLLSNNALEDFYKKYGLTRQTFPIQHSKPTDSFLFLLIGSKEVPYGLITIQNEKANAFRKKSKQIEYLDLMSTIGSLMEFKIREIEGAISNVLFESRNILYKSRLEAHFMAYVHDTPVSIIERNGDEISIQSKQEIDIFNSAIQRFFTHLYKTGYYVNFMESINFSEEYLKIKQEIIGKSKKIHFSYDTSKIQADYPIEQAGIVLPSFLLLNIIQNAFKITNKFQDHELILQINITTSDQQAVEITVLDNGNGFDKEILDNLEQYKQGQFTPNRKSSLYTIIDVLTTLENTLGGKASILFSNRDGEQGGAAVTLVLSKTLIEQFYSFTKNNT